MAEEPKLLSDETLSPRSLFALAALSIAVGACTGLVAASFRLLLQRANGWRTYFVLRAHNWGLLGFRSRLPQIPYRHNPGPEQAWKRRLVMIKKVAGGYKVLSEKGKNLGGEKKKRRSA